MIAAGERVFAVAPRATHRTAGQPDERARPAGVRRFTLDRMKDFGYAEHATILGLGSPNVDLPGKDGKPRPF